MIRKIIAFRNGEKIEEYVAEERELRILVNDIPVATAKLSPGFEKEFAIGYLIGEGLVRGINDIKDVRIEQNCAYVEAKKEFEKSYEQYLSTDCISGWRVRVEVEDIKVSSDYSVGFSEIINSMKELQRRAKNWRITGALHAAALINGNDFLIVEDISRHIAIDKIIGMGALKGVDFSQSYALCSGRLPGDMVIKMARVNIPIVCSRTAPILSGIECAEKADLTLVGFVRGRRMNIYTHPRRILLGK
jgi:formate dehydrogenase accessory protein FdhD